MSQPHRKEQNAPLGCFIWFPILLVGLTFLFVVIYTLYLLFLAFGNSF